MRVLAAVSAVTFMLSATASAWRINARSGVWMGEGSHPCTLADINPGETIYVSEVAPNEHVFFYQDEGCGEPIDIVAAPGRTVIPDTEIGSFEVKQLLPN